MRLPWIWHAMFDGTWLCHCKRSQENKYYFKYKKFPPSFYDTEKLD